MTYYYHEIFKKYVIAFSHLFSNIYVRRDITGGTQDYKVPIIYAGKRKLYYMLKELNNDKAMVSTILPRMGFVFSSIQYDPTRKLNQMFEIELDDGSILKHRGIPYNITCDLGIWTKNQDDMLQIVEQILPLFSPDISLSIKELPDPYNVTRDVPVILDSVNLSNIYEFGDVEERVLGSDLSFTIKGTLYPAITAAGTKIYDVITRYKVVDEVTDPPSADDLITVDSDSNIAVHYAGTISTDIQKSITEYY